MNAEEKRQKALNDFLVASALRLAKELGPEECAHLARTIQQMNDEHDQEVADRAIEFLEKKYCS